MIEITHQGVCIPSHEMAYLKLAAAVSRETGVDPAIIEGTTRGRRTLAARRILAELMRRHAGEMDKGGRLAKLTVQGQLMRGGVVRPPTTDELGRKRHARRWDQCRHTSIHVIRRSYQRFADTVHPELQDRTLAEVVKVIETRLGLKTDDQWERRQ